MDKTETRDSFTCEIPIAFNLEITVGEFVNGWDAKSVWNAVNRGEANVDTKYDKSGLSGVAQVYKDGSVIATGWFEKGDDETGEVELHDASDFEDDDDEVEDEGNEEDDGDGDGDEDDGD